MSNKINILTNLQKELRILSKTKIWVITVNKILKDLFPPRIELGTFCVLGRRDNRYTTETWKEYKVVVYK